MDNQLFNVNGSGEEMLLDALKLSFLQQGDRTTCKGWVQSKKHGLILCWYGNDNNSNISINNFPVGLNATQCLPFVAEWLKSDFAKNVTPNKWCGECDHDGYNTMGWQVYCEDWGHVNHNSYAICAIKPCCMWHGK